VVQVCFFSFLNIKVQLDENRVKTSNSVDNGAQYCGMHYTGMAATTFISTHNNHVMMGYEAGALIYYPVCD
jgi:NO-binding membrane sensor protein with MHYT domain